VSYRVPSLSLPALEDLTPEKLSLSEAAQLFMERAAAANPRFQLTESNALAVSQICHRLDGIPLALELAAARIKLFSSEQIADRLNDRFRLLTGGSRTALPRQQTLRALIDWSYDMLSEPERALLRRLSVFVGGWTFEAAEALCPDLDVLALLEQLVNKSLVVMEETLGQARYHMLETIRQYAREKLIEAGEATMMRDRHLDYFLQLSEQAEPEMHGNLAFEWFERLDADIDNIRSATDWGQEGRPEDVLILIGNLFFYWTLRVEDRHQAIRFLKMLLAKLETQPVEEPLSRRRLLARARGQTTVALLLMGTGDSRASMAAFTEAVTSEREAGDRFYLAFALGVQANQAIILGEFAAGHARAEESVTLQREMGDNRWLLISLPILAGIEDQLGNRARAVALRKESRMYVSQIDHPMFIPTFLGLGFEARSRGAFDEARAYFSEGLRLAKKVKTKFFATGLESELAHLDRESGDFQGARDAYRKLIGTWKDLGQYAAVAHLLECFAFMAVNEKEFERAARLFGAAEAIRENIHINMREDECPEYEHNVAALHRELEEAALDAAWAEGSAMDLEKAVHFAVAPG
jgi:predicted ATPase